MTGELGEPAEGARVGNEIGEEEAKCEEAAEAPGEEEEEEGLEEEEEEGEREAVGGRRTNRTKRFPLGLVCDLKEIGSEK